MEKYESIMDDTDWQHVVNLLSVCEMCSRYGPRYAAVSSEAMEELDFIKDKIVEDQEKKAKAKAEEEMKARAKAMADAKAAREKEEAAMPPPTGRPGAAGRPATPRVS